MTKYRNCSRVVGSRSLAPATALKLGHLFTTGLVPGAWCPLLIVVGTVRWKNKIPLNGRK